MGRIFLSHVEEDLESTLEVAKGLEASGYTTWYFERDTLPGTSYLLQITQAIENSDAIVLMASEDALSSDQVTKEVVGAFERGIPFIPVLVNITPPELKERQPEWRHALGGTAMIIVGTEGLQPVIDQTVKGLVARGIKPEGGKASIPSPVFFTPRTEAPRQTAERILAARSMEGERKQITVLFADVKGFTSLSEKLDPEEVHDLISPAVDIMTEEIHFYEGTIAQFLGDGLMALFGAPIAHEDAPIRAIHAALAIQERLSSYSKELKEDGIEFSMRIGLNTGLVIVGSIGDDLTMEYTAIGDTVNLASRMERSAEPGTVQVAENSYHQAEGYFDFEDLGFFEVKGKEKPVRAYRVISPRAPRTRVEASLPAGLSTFVGREMELGLLNHAYSQVCEGQAQVVGIAGEPGVGKSRLIYEFRNSLLEEDYTYLEGGCLHYGEAIAYMPILGILRSYFEIREGEPEVEVRERIDQKVATLERQPESLIHSLYEALSLEVDDEEYTKLEPQVRRQMVFNAIRQLLITESRNKPLIMTIEDLHWIDKTSEEFLNYLIDSMATNRILLILCYRPEYACPWTGKTYYSQIRVDQLPKKTSAELVASILSEGEVDQDITDLIVGKTSGNPLFIEELTHGLLENGSIIRDNEHYTLSAKLSDIQIPDTIQGIIAARLDRLEENLKRLIQTASVIGREFAYRLLQTITMMQEELRSHLSNLQSLELIYEKSFFPELEYIFKHALTQEVAYNSLLLRRRKELHASIGQAIEELYAERMEEFYEMLAFHYAASDNEEKALHYLKLAGTKATLNYSNWEAIAFCKEAIKILESRPETAEIKREKVKAYLMVLNPMTVLNFPEGSLEILHKAEKLSVELGEESSLAKVYSEMALYYTFRGNMPLGIEYAEKCLDESEKTGAIEILAHVTSGTANAQFFSGHVAEVADSCRRICGLLEKQGIENDCYMGGIITEYAHLSGHCGYALAALGDFDEANIWLEKGLKNSIEIGDRAGIGWVELCYSMSAFLEGDADKTISRARKAIEYFERVGWEFVLGVSHSFVGIGYYLLGEYEEAKKNAEKGLEINQEVGFTLGTGNCYYFLTMVNLALGDFESAKGCAKRALEQSRESKNKYYEACSLMLLGRIEGEEDLTKLEIAEQHIRKGISMAEEMKLKPQIAQGHMYLGELLILALRKEEALANLKIATNMGQEIGTGYWLKRTREALARLGAAPKAD